MSGLQCKIAGRRRGITIVLVLSIMFILFFLALGFDYFTRQFRARSYHSYFNEVAFQLAESGIARALVVWRDELNDPRNNVYQKLRSRSKKEIHLSVVNSDEDTDLRELTKDYPGSEITVNGTIMNISELAGAVTDPVEKTAQLRIEAHAQYKEVSKKIVVKKELRVINIAPPVLSRFTLFVQKAHQDDMNIFDTDSKGGFKSSGRALVLDNGSSTDIMNNGWIFLGGGKVYIHLARGSRDYGENFHLPDIITKSRFFPDPNYVLTHINVGYYADVKNENAYKNFPAVFKTSGLRLFGCEARTANVSPTLVLGDVWRRYVQATAIGLVDEASKKAYNFVLMPWAGNLNQIPRDPRIPPFLWLSPKLYYIYMSQVREEPFNRSYDFIVNAEDAAPPLILAMKYPSLQSEYYPNPGNDVQIPFPDGEVYYRGNLNSFDMKTAMTPRICYRVRDLDEFKQRFMNEENELKLNAIVEIESSVVDFRQIGRLRVYQGGIIVCPGDVYIDGVEIVGNPEMEALSIISTGGSIYVSPAQTDAMLIALNGSVKAQAQELNILGGLGTGRLILTDILKGGLVKYAEKFNPSREGYRNLYRIVLSPTNTVYWVENI